MIIEVLDLAIRNPFAFILYFLGAAAASLILGGIAYEIKDKLNAKKKTAKENEVESKKKTEKRISKKKRRELGEFYYFTNRLFNELLFYCYENNINISYVKPTDEPDTPFSPKSDTENASGYISYKVGTLARTYYPHSISIRLNPKNHLELMEDFEYSRTIFTLAHEVGHAISMLEYQDDSEEGADLEAYKFCKNIMKSYEEENIEIKSWVNGYFGYSSEGYQHPPTSGYNMNKAIKHAV